MESKSGHNGERGAGRPVPFFKTPVTWGIVALVALATLVPRWLDRTPSGTPRHDGAPATSPGSGEQHPPDATVDAGTHEQAGATDAYAAGIQEIEEPPREPLSSPGALTPDQARTLVDSLLTFNFEPDLPATDTVQRWKETLGRLVDGNLSSIPAISEFLSRMQDVNLAGIPETSGLGYPTVRLALIEALGDIGGPEAESALLAAMMETADPREIALLARTLNKLSPGAHLPETLAASREALELVRTGQIENQDVGPLFEVFRAFGDGQVAEELLTTAGDWTYYALLAVAGMPAETGLPALIEALRESGTPPGGSPDFAYRLLAQTALASGEASRALLDQARAGRIPATAWEGIAEALAGHEARIQDALFSDGLAALRQGSDVRVYRIALGNQAYLTAPLASMSPAEVEDRLELLDQLLALAGNPAQIAALQSRRDQLTTRTAHR